MQIRTKEVTKDGSEFENKMRSLGAAIKGTDELVVLTEFSRKVCRLIARNWVEETTTRSKIKHDLITIARLSDDTKEVEKDRTGVVTRNELTQEYAMIPFDARKFEAEGQELPPILSINVKYYRQYYLPFVFTVSEHWHSKEKLSLPDGTILRPPTAVSTIPFFVESLRQTGNEMSPPYMPTIAATTNYGVVHTAPNGARWISAAA